MSGELQVLASRVLQHLDSGRKTPETEALEYVVKRLRPYQSDEDEIRLLRIAALLGVEFANVDVRK